MHFPPKFLQKRFPPTFSMVHLLHRLYGVDAPDHYHVGSTIKKSSFYILIGRYGVVDVIVNVMLLVLCLWQLCIPQSSWLENLLQGELSTNTRLKRCVLLQFSCIL